MEISNIFRGNKLSRIRLPMICFLWSDICFLKTFSRLMFCILYANSILPYVLFIIKRYHAYQCTRKTKHCLYLYPQWYFPVFKQKLEKFREFTVFHILFARKNFRESAFAEFFAEITFANLPEICENRESFFPRKFLPLLK